jgi:ribosome biogenesis GTPase / thiamine phosphate phosphatase
VTSRTLAARGRVVAIGGGMAAVRVDGEERIAKLAGRLRTRARPVAGDDVDVTLMDDGTARIDRIDERRTQLVRAQRLGRGDQVLLANADLLVVVAAAADPPLRRGLIDRLLVAAWAGGLDAALVITKADLADAAEEPPAQVLADYADLGYAGALVDARSEEAGRVVRALIGGRLAAFAGHSGVGKSTLVNTVTGGEQLTGAVNEVIGRGRHTTTAARVVHGTGIEVIDTPGIRGFSPAGLEPRELGFAFPEIAEAAAGCRFRTCLHAGEAGCAVEDAVDPRRFASYRKLLAELRGEEPAEDDEPPEG